MQVYADSYTSAKSDTKPMKAIPKTVGQHVQIQASRPIPQVQSWMPWASDQLKAMAKLKPNWDSYAGEPPSRVAMGSADLMLRAVHTNFGNLFGRQSQPQAVAPRADGGVQMEWSTPPFEVAVHVDASGTLGYLSIDRRGNRPTYQEVPSASFKDVLDAIAYVVYAVPR
jgi:hypothetical protein